MTGSSKPLVRNEKEKKRRNVIVQMNSEHKIITSMSLSSIRERSQMLRT